MVLNSLVSWSSKVKKKAFFRPSRNANLCKTMAKGGQGSELLFLHRGFSVYAAAGGASHVDSVDISETAIKTAERNMTLY